MSVIKKITKNPYYIIPILNHFNLLNWMSDETFIKLNYRGILGRRLNLKEPRLFTEKLQWLKLHDRKPEYTRMVDKYEARKYIEEKVGGEYLVPLIGVWDKFEDIDFSTLPSQFVLKCTHDSGGVFICKDKSSLDVSEAKKKLNKCMKNNYYWKSREYPYKNVKPRIICEKYLVDESGTELKDYKVFCFNGKAKFVQVNHSRFIKHKINVYDLHWNLLPFEMVYPNDPNTIIEQPKQFDKMIGISEILSKKHALIRVDFYSVLDKIYIGELTLYPTSGHHTFNPHEYDAILGEWLKLPM